MDWDLTSEAGATALHRLIETSDIFIHDLTDADVELAKLSYAEVGAVKKNIIYVRCIGFDPNGPYSEIIGDEDLIQAASGVASLLGRVDGDPSPRYLPMSLAQKVSGLHATYGVLAAVFHYLRTEEGQYVQISMFEAVTSYNLVEHLWDMTYIPPTGLSCYARQVDPTRQPMRTRDGYIAIAPYLDDRWVRFFECAGHAEVLLEPRFSDWVIRRANMHQMYEKAAEILPERNTDEWLTMLNLANVPAMRVNDFHSLLADPQIVATGIFKERTHPTAGKYIEVGPPVRFAAFDYPESTHAVDVGHHSSEVALELGVPLPNQS